MIRKREPSPYARYATDEADAWWRQHPRASFSEFADWVEDRYLPRTEGGLGFRHGYNPGELMQEGLDDVHEALYEVIRRERELRRRRAEAA